MSKLYFPPWTFGNFHIIGFLFGVLDEIHSACSPVFWESIREASSASRGCSDPLITDERTKIGLANDSTRLVDNQMLKKQDSNTSLFAVSRYFDTELLSWFYPSRSSKRLYGWRFFECFVKQRQSENTSNPASWHYFMCVAVRSKEMYFIDERISILNRYPDHKSYMVLKECRVHGTVLADKYWEAM